MKCEQCGFLVDSLPEGGGEYLCPNCGWVMRKSAPSAAADGQPSPTDTTSATHLKIAKTVNVGFGDFASVLAAADASKIPPTDSPRDIPDRTRTASASTLTVEEPDDDEVLSPLDVYDEDDEYARIQADIASRRKALDERAVELDTREKYLNKKLDEIIAEKEFLRSGIEKNDEERASYLKQKGILDAQRSDMEKEIAARKASLDARAAEIEKKTEAMNRMRTELEKLKRELDISMTGEQPVDDATTSSVSIPYSAKLLRTNNRLERTVRIQKRILIGLVALIVILILLLFVKESELRRVRTRLKRLPECTYMAAPARTEAVSAPSADTLKSENLPAPESETSGGGL